MNTKTKAFHKRLFNELSKNGISGNLLTKIWEVNIFTHFCLLFCCQILRQKYNHENLKTPETLIFCRPKLRAYKYLSYFNDFHFLGFMMCQSKKCQADKQKHFLNVPYRKK